MHVLKIFSKEIALQDILNTCCLVSYHFDEFLRLRSELCIYFLVECTDISQICIGISLIFVKLYFNLIFQNGVELINIGTQSIEI